MAASLPLSLPRTTEEDHLSSVVVHFYHWPVNGVLSLSGCFLHSMMKDGSPPPKPRT